MRNSDTNEKIRKLREILENIREIRNYKNNILRLETFIKKK